jgi:hypothetical protein
LPRPRDAGYLLRPETTLGYASGVPDQPQWIEIDLGQPRAVDSGRIIWLDPTHFASEFVVEGRLFPEQDWETLFADRDNRSSHVDFSFQPQWIRYIRLSGTRFAGRDRMMIRRFHLFACPDGAAGELPTREPHSSETLVAIEPRDVVQREQGAIILTSSAFYPPPHDVEYLLRPETKFEYASALPDQPQWIEIDLGQPRAVDSGQIVWLDPTHFAVEFVIEGRLSLEQDWEPLFTDSENRASRVDFSFLPQRIRYVRLRGTCFASQDRMLIRRFRLFACFDGLSAEPPSLDAVAG